MQATLAHNTRRFFFGTYNVVFVIIIIGLAIRVSFNAYWIVSLVGVVGGAVVYMYSEALAHRRMHKSGTLFFSSHTEHHLKKTPESGLPKPWVYLMYLAIGIVLSSFNLPLAQGFYLGLISYLSLYEYIHFLCHCNYRPKTRLGWRIRVNHLKHHNHDETQHFELMFLKKKRDEASVS
jgi:H+/Cl- antiporter ClcA